MLTLGGETSKNCQQCSARNEDYARFCVQCGNKFVAYSNLDCPACGCSDYLNGPFCIRCGAATPVGRIKTAARTAFSWRKNSKRTTIYEKITISVERGVSDSKKVITWLHAAAIMAGIICGVILGTAMVPNMTFPPLVRRLQWPSGGLVIYCEEPLAAVKLETIQPNGVSGELHCFMGLLGQSGSMSVHSLPVGEYLLTLEARRRKTFVQAVTISQGHPTVLGFPDRIKLPIETEL